MNFYKLNATIIYQKPNYIIYGKKIIKFSIENLDSNLIKHLLNQLKKGISAQYFFELCESHPLRSIINRLHQKDLITPYSTEYTNSPLEKSYDLFSHFLASNATPFKFKNNIHVIIVGCGGIGGNIALGLVSSGFNRFTLIDYDKVEASNLNRQFSFSRDDIGKNKVTALENRLVSINPKAIITTFNKEIISEESLSSVIDQGDIIISGIDTPIIKSSIYTAEFALKKNIPIIYGSVGYQSLKAGPLLDTTRSKKAYIAYLSKLKNISAEPISGSLLSTNALLTSIMTNNIISYFYPIAKTPLLNCMWIIDPFSLSYRTKAYYETN
jgi:molybdopterin/thiamine biosynthesis adenylyltransferase